jgi:hypothetical protein
MSLPSKYNSTPLNPIVMTVTAATARQPVRRVIRRWRSDRKVCRHQRVRAAERPFLHLRYVYFRGDADIPCHQLNVAFDPQQTSVAS